MNTSSFATHWHLHIPSLVLVAMIYLVVLRGVLGLLLGWDHRNVVARSVAAITYPALALVGAMTPRSVPRIGVLVFTLVWLFVLLGLIVYVLAALGRRPLWA